MTKQEISEHVQSRVKMLINDCRTFIYAKIHLGSDKNQNLVNYVGGGNFLCALGIFSLLNLLGKINEVVDGGDINTKENITQIKKEFFSFRKKYPDEATLLNQLVVSGFSGNPKKSEKDCFIKLFNDTKDFINWGLDNKTAGSFWSNFRNKLSHIAIPADAVAGLPPEKIKDKDFFEILDAVKNSKYPIYGKNGIRDGEVVDAIAIERFTESIPKIANYVVEKIKKVESEEILHNITEIIT